MRVYDFECTACGKVEERFVRGSEVHEVKCRSCGGAAHRKLCSPRFALDPNDKAGFPTAYANWEKQFKHKRANAKPDSE